MNEKEVQQDENQFIFDKKIKCPICDKQFVTKQMKTGKARFLGTEDDLRPMYDGVDPIKYDIVMCPHCGYAALSNSFDTLTARQITKIKEEIQAKFQPVQVPEGPYDYTLAIRRYKMALITAMTRNIKISEGAYLCLKLSWLYRAAAKELEELQEDNTNKIEEYNKREVQYREKAYEGFTAAMGKEYFPICNMDEVTFNFLLSELAYKCNDIANAKQFAFMVISSHSASAKVKDKARALVDELKAVSSEE